MPSTVTVCRNPSIELRAVDRDLLDTLRGGSPLGVGELTDALGVTATAVRQRIDRLLDAGLIERQKVVAGRGRPTFTYALTALGQRLAGANHTELAEAMWQEILALPSAEVRTQLLAAIGRRLGRQYRQQLSDGPLEGRMRALTEVLAGRRIPVDLRLTDQPPLRGTGRQAAAQQEPAASSVAALPVIGISACPFPELTDPSDQRAMCQLEEEMLSEALGRPVHLTSCRLDGDRCCQFSPQPSTDGPCGEGRENPGDDLKAS